MKIAGHRTDDPTEILLPVRVPRRRARPTPNEILAAALAAAVTTEEELLLLLAAYAGLRRKEIATLHTDDRIGDWLQITGKGGATRLVPVHDVLRPYLDLKSVGYYFPGRFAAHRHPDWVGKHISRLLGPGYTAHQLRHWFGTTVYRSTKDIRAVQELLGHADLATTQTYIGVGDDAMTTAVATLPDLRTTPTLGNTL